MRCLPRAVVPLTLSAALAWPRIGVIEHAAAAPSLVVPSSSSSSSVDPLGSTGAAVPTASGASIPRLHISTAKRLKVRQENASLKKPTAPKKSSSSSSSSVAPTPEATKMRILHLTNMERKKLDLPLLQRDPRLEAAAQEHAMDMAGQKYLDHTSPDGVAPLERMRSRGYTEPSCSNCTWQFYFGENLAWSRATKPEIIMQYWLRSKEHRAHIFSPHYRDIGLGLENGYWVQVFAGMEIEMVKYSNAQH